MTDAKAVDERSLPLRIVEMIDDHGRQTRLSIRLAHYAALDTADRDTLDRACDDSRLVPAHCDLAREGDAADAMFVVLDGLACRYKVMPGARRQILGFILPGESCDVRFDEVGEMDHSIGTLVSSNVVALASDQVDALSGGSAAVARAFRIAQQVDSAIARAWIANLGRRSSTERLAHLACELYVRLAQVGLAQGDRARIPLTQIMLGDALGLTAVHINRVLRLLRDAGMMGMERDHLIVAEPEKLARLGGFDDAYLRSGFST